MALGIIRDRAGLYHKCIDEVTRGEQVAIRAGGQGQSFKLANTKLVWEKDARKEPENLRVGGIIPWKPMSIENLQMLMEHSVKCSRKFPECIK